MSRVLRIYQYLAPAVLGPLSFWLWWREYGNLPQTLAAWLIPVLWAYLVPGIGTNVCKVWEFDVRWKIGRFRPHHGFVFGSATSTIAWLLHGDTAQTSGDVLRSAVVLCSVLGFWNLLYEIKALHSGLLRVYNQPWADGGSATDIALDYAPWFFGGFGFAYGLGIGLAEFLTARHGLPSWGLITAYLAGMFALGVALPVLGFMRHSIHTHGHPGTQPAVAKKR
jgi:hypothetical protein